MKNQYFADDRDYFKYDLVLFLMRRLGFRRFTFIPMLTPNDGTSDGGVAPRDVGAGDPVLHEFLLRCFNNGTRDITLLRDFFADEAPDLEYLPYRDREFFEHTDRTSYFAEVPEDQLRDAVALVDPDVGFLALSAKSHEAHKYVRYGEIGGLVRRMGENSLLLVFQWTQIPNKWADSLQKITARLQEVVPRSRVSAVRNHPVGFVVLAQSNFTQAQARRALGAFMQTRGPYRKVERWPT